MENINDRIKKIVLEFHLPRYAELTNVGLYLEQTVKLINTALSSVGDKVITGTMISNYVKQKLVENPIKRQYYADHIARLIFITVAKTTMSLEDIRLIMTLQREQYDLAKAYNYFCDEFENILLYTFGLTQTLSEFTDTNSQAKDLLRTSIIAVVDKLYLNCYIITYRERRLSAQNAEVPAKSSTKKFNK